MTATCNGCYDDFYNARPEGCWHKKDATIMQRIRIHRDAMPPYSLKTEPTLSCWHGQVVKAYKRETFTDAGYWK